MTRILIVDDEPSIRASLRMMLQDNYDVLESADGRNAVETVKKEAVDLVLLDIRLPEIDGLQVLEQIREIDDSLNVIVLTADRTVSTAVGAMKRGAFDYITKPFEVDELESVVIKALENRRLITENKYLRTEVSKVAPDNMIGESPAMKKMFQLVRDVADSDATVMITGESGTGKELIARAVHKMSKRADRLFVPVSCAAIPENLLESELFGHEKGSFTGAFDRHIGKFEVASGGTLFLDEIGFLPFSMQAKLLRAVQEREIERVGGSKPIKIDVRIVAATNVNLEKAVEEGTFRRDLYYRLNVVPVELPPLRERPGDVHRLLSHFLEKFNKTFHRSIKGFTPEAIELLEKYSWPGNVRELQNLVERLIVLTRESMITAQMLPPEISRSPEAPTSDDFSGMSFKEATRRFESQFIEAVIQKAGGNKSRAARMLGIHRNTLLQLEKKAKTIQSGEPGAESEGDTPESLN